jgi:hypothetical protein
MAWWVDPVKVAALQRNQPASSSGAQAQPTD